MCRVTAAEFYISTVERCIVEFVHVDHKLFKARVPKHEYKGHFIKVIVSRLDIVRIFFSVPQLGAELPVPVPVAVLRRALLFTVQYQNALVHCPHCLAVAHRLNVDARGHALCVHEFFISDGKIVLALVFLNVHTHYIDILSAVIQHKVPIVVRVYAVTHDQLLYGFPCLTEQVILINHFHDSILYELLLCLPWKVSVPCKFFRLCKLFPFCAASLSERLFFCADICLFLFRGHHGSVCCFSSAFRFLYGTPAVDVIYDFLHF